MNQNIENIRLKNGEEYPVSPAYFDGTIVPFEADLSSAERATFSIDLGGDPIVMEGIKISNEMFQMETLQKYTWGKINSSIPGEGELETEAHMMQIFDNLRDMVEAFNPQFAAFDIRSVPGYGTFFYPEFSIAVATEAGTFHDTSGVVTITFPSVGTYLITESSLPPVGTVRGEMHFGEYHIPEGYLQTSREVEDLYPVRWGFNEIIGGPMVLSLFSYPTFYAKLYKAAINMNPIRIHMRDRVLTYDIVDGDDYSWGGPVGYKSDTNELCRSTIVFVPKEDMEVTTVASGAIESVEVDAEVYEAKTKGNMSEMTFTFDGSDWLLGGNNVAIAEYGITFSGEATEGDTIKTQLYGDCWVRGYEVICTIPQQQSAT